MGLKENLWTVDKIKHTLTKHRTQGRAETRRSDTHTELINYTLQHKLQKEKKKKLEMSQWAPCLQVQNNTHQSDPWTWTTPWRAAWQATREMELGLTWAHFTGMMLHNGFSHCSNNRRFHRGPGHKEVCAQEQRKTDSVWKFSMRTPLSCCWSG